MKEEQKKEEPITKEKDDSIATIDPSTFKVVTKEM